MSKYIFNEGVNDGSSTATTQLAIMCLHGDEKVEVAFSNAVKLFKKAAYRGNIVAMLFMAIISEERIFEVSDYISHMMLGYEMDMNTSFTTVLYGEGVGNEFCLSLGNFCSGSKALF